MHKFAFSLHTMFAPNDWRTELTQQKDSSKLFYSSLASTACYIIAYVFAYLINQLVTARVAAGLYIKTVMYMHRLDFRIAADFWNRPRVIITFLAGPVACLVLGIIVFRVYKHYKKQTGWEKLLFLWLYLHLVNMFFGAYVAGVITRTNFRYVSNYMSVPENAEFAIAFVCVVAMFIFGYFATKLFLQTSLSQTLIQKFKRPTFILCTVIFPWMIGSSILYLSKYPNMTNNEIIVFMMLFTIVVPVSIVQRNFQEVNLVKTVNAVRFSWMYVVIAIAVLILFRLLFREGLTIGSWIR